MRVGEKLYRPNIDHPGEAMIEEYTINDISDDWLLVVDERHMEPGLFRLEPIFMGLIGKVYFTTKIEALEQIRIYIRKRSDDLLKISQWLIKEMTKECPQTSTSDITPLSPSAEKPFPSSQ